MDLERIESKKRRIKGPDIPYDCWTVIVTFLDSSIDFLNLVRSVSGFWDYVQTLNTKCTENVIFRVHQFPLNEIKHAHTVQVRTKYEYTRGNESSVFLTSSFDPLNRLFPIFVSMKTFRVSTKNFPQHSPFSFSFDMGKETPVSPNLNRLEVRGGKISKLRIICSQFPNLVSVSMWNLRESVEFVGEPKLKFVEMKYSGNVLVLPGSFFSTCLTLERIHYSRCRFPSIELSGLPLLQELKLQKSFSFTERCTGSIGIIRDFPSLRILQICLVDQDGVIVQDIDFKSLPNLQSLKLRYTVNEPIRNSLTSAAMEGSLMGLNELEIDRYYRHISYFHFESLSQLSNLVRLVLANLYFCTSSNFRLSALNLKELVLEGCVFRFESDAKGTEFQITQCPNLLRMRIAECNFEGKHFRLDSNMLLERLEYELNKRKDLRVFESKFVVIADCPNLKEMKITGFDLPLGDYLQKLELLELKMLFLNTKTVFDGSSFENLRLLSLDHDRGLFLQETVEIRNLEKLEELHFFPFTPLRPRLTEKLTVEGMPENLKVFIFDGSKKKKISLQEFLEML